MTKKIKQYILRLSIAGLLFAPALAPAAHVGATGPGAGGDGPALQDNLCGGAEHLQLGETGECEATEPQENVNNLITSVINIFSAVVGVIAVIMILFGGFKYITAGGDSSKITSAQHTIIYAIVGLVIVALAQIVVRFVLFRAVVVE
jgi:hypothetical protein